jgi:hypothetical protein
MSERDENVRTEEESPEIPKEELDDQTGEPLPDREVMSVIAPIEGDIEFGTPGGPPDETW